MPSCLPLSDTMTVCWKTACQRHTASRVSADTTCHLLANPPDPTLQYLPMRRATLSVPRTFTQASSQVMDHQASSCTKCHLNMPCRSPLIRPMLGCQLPMPMPDLMPPSNRCRRPTAGTTGPRPLPSRTNSSRRRPRKIKDSTLSKQPRRRRQTPTPPTTSTPHSLYRPLPRDHPPPAQLRTQVHRRTPT